ncbi:hypothetical protein Scep_022188 [Stephania cephalantha]|uniref:Glycosyltransferase n=1 Tax=Stephania cephalantha TaxID=152367 RepID=A0AAP0I2G6_9MAGN
MSSPPTTTPTDISDGANSPHVLVFPYPAQGHMLPLLDLTHHLVLCGATATIIITPKNLPFLRPLLSTHPQSVHPLVLPFPSHPHIPPGVENVKDIGNSGNPAIISALHSLSLPITQWFSSHPSPPSALLSDFFLGWTLHLAARLSIPRIAFYSSGAFLASINHHLWPNLHLLNNNNNSPAVLLSFPHLPYSPSFSRSHLPSLLLRHADPSDSDPIQAVFVKDSMLANASSWGVVFNSFDAVEAPFLDHVRKELRHARVWAVGPIPVLSGGPSQRGGPSSASASDVLNWLDDCSIDGSVVYACFGSQVVLTRRQVEALGEGLERSGARFILVMKPSDEEVCQVLRGLEDRVVGRGLVITGWAPQVEILSHRAVGGFVTHCGWNSVLEGLVGGVVLLAWPMEADQFVNAKLLVEYLRIGVVVCEGRDSVPDSDELGLCVAELMGEGGSEVRVRAMKLREEAVEGVKGRGNSARDFDRLVEALRELHPKK